MTLAVAIEADGGIVLAADSRAMFGDPRGVTVVNDTVNKIFAPNNRLAIALSGVADTGNALMQQLTPNLAVPAAHDVDNAATIIRTGGIQTLNQWFGPPQFLMSPQGQPIPAPRPDIVYLLAGYTSAGRPKIITQASSPMFNFAPNTATTGFHAIGVVTLAMYLLNRLYRPGIPLGIAKDLAAYCISETASQDGKVGGPIRMSIVKANEDSQTLSPDEITALGQRVNLHREALRNSFIAMNGAQ